MRHDVAWMGPGAPKVQVNSSQKLAPDLSHVTAFFPATFTLTFATAVPHDFGIPINIYKISLVLFSWGKGILKFTLT